MKLMIQAVIESFIRAVIRFWDNRFRRKDNVTEPFREEISYLRRRNDELTSFILNSIKPITAEGDESELESSEQIQSIGRPIETSFQRRKRLEQQSLSEWNKLVQEAKDKAVKAKEREVKTTEELEKQILES